MIQFLIRRNDQYLDVLVIAGDTSVDLGLLNETERTALAGTLREAFYDLTGAYDGAERIAELERERDDAVALLRKRHRDATATTWCEVDEYLARRDHD